MNPNPLSTVMFEWFPSTSPPKVLKFDTHDSADSDSRAEGVIHCHLDRESAPQPSAAIRVGAPRHLLARGPLFGGRALPHERRRHVDPARTRMLFGNALRGDWSPPAPRKICRGPCRAKCGRAALTNSMSGSLPLVKRGGTALPRLPRSSARTRRHSWSVSSWTSQSPASGAGHTVAMRNARPWRLNLAPVRLSTAADRNQPQQTARWAEAPG